MTETEFNILDALATYRFLTAKQLHRLRVTKNENWVYAVLRELEKREWVQCIKFDFKGFGVSYVWRLRPAGAEAHAEEAQGKPVAIPRRLSKQDREHCLAVVDFHISVREFAHKWKQRVDYFVPYFGSSTKVSGGGQVINPDALFQLSSDTNRLFALEWFEDTDSDRPFKKLKAYLPVIEAQAIENACRYDGGVPILFAFRDPAVEKALRERLRKWREFHEFAPRFFFRADPEFVGGWSDIHGNQKALPTGA